jgi:hypothetical protein
LGARETGLVANDGHDSFWQNAAGFVGDGTGYAAKGLLRLSAGCKQKRHPQGRDSQENDKSNFLSFEHSVTSRKSVSTPVRD